MLVLKFEKPTLSMIKHIADNMRKEDVNEVWASNRQTPYEALIDGWNQSMLSVIVTINNEPCVMIGLVIRDILSGIGTPWLLGTEGALKYKSQFLKLSPDIVNEMLELCPLLINYVHTENKHSIKWLKWIGFTIDEAEPYGLNKKLFHKFHIEK